MIGGGACSALACFSAIRYYQSYRNERALQAAAQFSAMTAALQAQRSAPRSRQIADGLIKDFPSSPYADQAQLTLARLDVDDGQLAKRSRP